MPSRIARWNSFSATKPSRSEGKLAYSDRTAKRLAHLVPLSRSTRGRGFASLFHLSTPGSLSVMAATGPAMSPNLLRQPAGFARFLGIIPGVLPITNTGKLLPLSPHNPNIEAGPCVQPSVFDMLAGASPASAMDGWAE
jgi:hypothetical protein